MCIFLSYLHTYLYFTLFLFFKSQTPLFFSFFFLSFFLSFFLACIAKPISYITLTRDIYNPDSNPMENSQISPLHTLLYFFSFCFVSFEGGETKITAQKGKKKRKKRIGMGVRKRLEKRRGEKNLLRALSSPLPSTCPQRRDLVSGFPY